MIDPLTAVRLWLLVALGGCGRLAFEPTPLIAGDAGSGDTSGCAEISHDEDSDGVDDACDVCPQLADDGADSDGDLVGDACDLAATQQQRTFFDPFTSARDEWQFDMRSAFLGDSVTLPGTLGGVGMQIFGAPGRAVFEVGGRTMNGTANRQIAIHMAETTSMATVYCEMYGTAGNVSLNITHTLDGATFNTLGMTPVAGSLDNVTVRLVYEYTPPGLRCTAWLSGVRYEVQGTDPGGVTPDKVGVATFDLDLEAEYFVRLTTP